MKKIKKLDEQEMSDILFGIISKDWEKTKAMGKVLIKINEIMGALDQLNLDLIENRLEMHRIVKALNEREKKKASSEIVGELQDRLKEYKQL